jgi:hypothetical protein
MARGSIRWCPAVPSPWATGQGQDIRLQVPVAALTNTPAHFGTRQDCGKIPVTNRARGRAMSLYEIASSEAEYLRTALGVIASVDATIITLSQPGLALPLVIECVRQNRFLIGPPPTRGGWPTQAISQKRVELSQAEMRSRACVWARSNRLAS